MQLTITCPEVTCRRCGERGHQQPTAVFSVKHRLARSLPDFQVSDPDYVVVQADAPAGWDSNLCAVCVALRHQMLADFENGAVPESTAPSNKILPPPDRSPPPLAIPTPPPVHTTTRVRIEAPVLRAQSGLAAGTIVPAAGTSRVFVSAPPVAAPPTEPKPIPRQPEGSLKVKI